MVASGFNPMRWNCDKDGCFNVVRRPKIEAFADCFPRAINFGDVDGLVELNGRFCLLEWKGEGGSLRNGQVKCFIAFTDTVGNIVLVAHGDAETMHVTGYSEFWGGRHLPPVKATLTGLKQRVRRWVEWTEAAKAAV
jgi:hypothetical protein